MPHRIDGERARGCFPDTETPLLRPSTFLDLPDSCNEDDISSNYGHPRPDACMDHSERSTMKVSPPRSLRPRIRVSLPGAPSLASRPSVGQRPSQGSLSWHLPLPCYRDERSRHVSKAPLQRDSSAWPRDSSMTNMTSSKPSVTAAMTLPPKIPVAYFPSRRYSRPEIEISPGVYAHFVGAQETLQAWKLNLLVSCACMMCNSSLLCKDEASMVYCPICYTISSKDSINNDTGILPTVGLGIQAVA